MKHLVSANISFPGMLAAILLSIAATPTSHADDGVIVFGDLTKETTGSYGRFHRAFSDAEGFLNSIKFNRSAISTTNYFAVAVGGIDAIRDLEDGRGVDPETLGALYAGYAIPDVSKHLNLKFLRGGKIMIDAPDGRLRYKGTVVRLYSPARLQALYATRKALSEEDDRQRTKAFSQFIAQRLNEQARSDQAGAQERVQGLEIRYQRIREAINELDQALRVETDMSSILPANFTHLFGFSSGGLNVLSLLENHQVVDPVTLAAIYASEIETNAVADLRIDERGLLFYKDQRTRMLSISDLQNCFRRRDVLELQSRSR